jgi:hypothetical protein
MVQPVASQHPKPIIKNMNRSPSSSLSGKTGPPPDLIKVLGTLAKFFPKLCIRLQRALRSLLKAFILGLKQSIQAKICFRTSDGIQWGGSTSLRLFKAFGSASLVLGVGGDGLRVKDDRLSTPANPNRNPLEFCNYHVRSFNAITFVSLLFPDLCSHVLTRPHSWFR